MRAGVQKYMRSFAQAWPEAEFVQAVLAQLPWYHHLALLDKLNTAAERRWYAAQAKDIETAQGLAQQLKDQA